VCREGIVFISLNKRLPSFALLLLMGFYPSRFFLYQESKREKGAGECQPERRGQFFKVTNKPAFPF